jgi:hypothetical protein
MGAIRALVSLNGPRKETEKGITFLAVKLVNGHRCDPQQSSPNVMRRCGGCQQARCDFRVLDLTVVGWMGIPGMETIGIF